MFHVRPNSNSIHSNSPSPRPVSSRRSSSPRPVSAGPSSGDPDTLDAQKFFAVAVDRVKGGVGKVFEMLEKKNVDNGLSPETIERILRGPEAHDGKEVQAIDMIALYKAEVIHPWELRKLKFNFWYNTEILQNFIKKEGVKLEVPTVAFMLSHPPEIPASTSKSPISAQEAIKQSIRNWGTASTLAFKMALGKGKPRDLNAQDKVEIAITEMATGVIPITPENIKVLVEEGILDEKTAQRVDYSIKSVKEQAFPPGDITPSTPFLISPTDTHDTQPPAKQRRLSPEQPPRLIPNQELINDSMLLRNFGFESQNQSARDFVFAPPPPLTDFGTSYSFEHNENYENLLPELNQMHEVADPPLHTYRPLKPEAYPGLAFPLESPAHLPDDFPPPPEYPPEGPAF